MGFKKVLFPYLFFFSMHVFAQERVTVALTNARFEEFVAIIENTTPFHFFYNHNDTDSISVSINVHSVTLDEALNFVLQPEHINYTIYQNQIFITGNRKIFVPPEEKPFDTTLNQDKKGDEFDYSDFLYSNKQRSLESKIFLIGAKSKATGKSVKLYGRIKDFKTGETIPGASISVDGKSVIASDQLGRYSLILPPGQYQLSVKSIGMKKTSRTVLVYSEGSLDIELTEEITPLKEVVVTSERENRVMDLQMGSEKLTIKTIKRLPTTLGEVDVLKAVLLTPGVQTVGEGTLGFNVRGGTSSQNLILYNDAVVYNPSHLFGFFSTFNADVIKSVELFKSGITADYGGRIASVLDVKSIDGNLRKMNVTGGLGPVTGRLTIELPILKEKASLVVSGRTTYSEWLLNQITVGNLQNSSANFYDWSANYSHKINSNNSLFISAYTSKDKFKLRSDTIFQYGNTAYSAQWKSSLNEKLFAVITGTFSNYDFSVSSTFNPINAFKLNYDLKQFQGKADFTYSLGRKGSIQSGVNVIHYGLSPGNFEPLGKNSLETPNTIQSEQGNEYAGYAGVNFEINDLLSVYMGSRYSVYESIGPRSVFQYQSGTPKDPASIVDTVQYPKGKPVATYQGAEPRVSLRYSLSSKSSLKVNYNRMRQYIQVISNTTAITPFDIWKLCDSYIKPQIGDQVSVGFYRQLFKGVVEFSAETYYKTMQNMIDYKGGAVLLLNNHLETDIVNTHGKAYGIEFLFKKSTGKLNGWLSYTYSRSFMQTTSHFSAETINNGNWYRSNYDKPHAVNLATNYKFNRRLNCSLNFVYSTGRPITLPVAQYSVEGVNRVFYSERNQFRIPDYIRTDISINVEGNHKIRKLAHSSWTLGVYNLFGRQNAYSVFFTSQNGSVQGYKLSIFARPIPAITYNFKF